MAAQQNPLEVQKQLRRDGLKSVVDRYKLKMKRHKDHNNLVCLRYIQNKSNMKHTVSQECRGIVLDEDNSWAVACYPYAKFFNYKEKEAAKVDWKTSRVYKKLDGSIATLYHYSGTWHVASSSLPDGSGGLVNGLLFKDIFWEIWEAQGYALPNDKTICYMFEMLDPRHRIVCEVKQQRLVLHGTRSLSCFTERDHIKIAKKQNWLFTEPTPLKDLESCVLSASGIDPKQEEGYVVCDAQFRRVKIKSPAYVSLSYMSGDGRATGPRLLYISLRGESPEFGGYFPEYKDLLGHVDRALDYLCSIYNPLITHVCENYHLLQLSTERFVKRVVNPLTNGAAREVNVTLLQTICERFASLQKYLKAVPQKQAWGILKAEVPNFNACFTEDSNGLVIPCEQGAVGLLPVTSSSKQKPADFKRDIVTDVQELEDEWDKGDEEGEDEKQPKQEPSGGKKKKNKKSKSRGNTNGNAASGGRAPAKSRNLFEELQNLND
eukprot:TRINITY_DN6050_c5_g1_i1.p1 TRINITY_DN6050_c5_g1~~TRINITY_DN6050_c5_g1_i1.p1  ORF type:complete len:499 (+),score=97.34 TRINITY_DN6050_c5_g1_i1:27-1499(+)